MSIEDPYVLAKLQRAVATPELGIYAGRTHTGSSTSGREVVTAIDSQGLNIYNIRSNQVAISYSLSPSTKFHCPPVSQVNRETLVRRSYAALQHGQDDMKLQCWTETGTDGATEVSTYSISERVLAIEIIDEMPLIVYGSGRIQRFSAGLEEILNTIEPGAYINHGKSKVLCARLLQLPNANEVELRLLVRQDSLFMYHINLSSITKKATGEVVFYERKVQFVQNHAVLARHIAIGPQGQLAIVKSIQNHFEIHSFTPGFDTTNVMRVVNTDGSNDKSCALQWLTDKQVLLSTKAGLHILDLLYSTTQASLKNITEHKILAIIPQKTTRIHADQARSVLVLANNRDLLLAVLTFGSSMTLMRAMGKDRAEHQSESWLQDVFMQSTWKDSIVLITKPAKTALESIAEAKSAKAIDVIFQSLVFPQDNATKGNGSQAQQGRDTINGNTLTNGHVNNKQNGHVNGKVVPLTDSTKLRSFEKTQTDVSLSVPFVSALLQIIFAKTADSSKSSSLPEATIDFLLRKGLLSTSSIRHANLDLVEVLSRYPQLRIRFISDVSGLLPSEVVTILKSYLEDEAHLPRALSAALPKLDKFDETLVVDAIKNGLEHSEVEKILQLLNSELFLRLEATDVANNLSVSDEVLCASITRHLDALTLSNLVFSKNTEGLVDSMRPALAQLIAQTEVIASTSSCVSELLMKARLLDYTGKAKGKGYGSQGATSENPEPEARKGPMSLDKVKKPEQNQSRRAKAYSRVQGIGALYTIETLQI